MPSRTPTHAPLESFGSSRVGLSADVQEPPTASAASNAAMLMGFRSFPGRTERGAVAEVEIAVDVLVGIPAPSAAIATFPFILEGIHRRAEQEIRERPELGRIRIGVRHVPPNHYDPAAGAAPDDRVASDQRRQGTIFIYPFEQRSVEAFARQGVAVSLLETYAHLGIDSIDNDDVHGMTTLVGRLHEAGHRRIGFLSWPYPVTGTWVARRFKAFESALRERGLELRDKWAINAPNMAMPVDRSEVSNKAAAQIREAGVTAWVCAADHQAYPLIRDLQGMGIRVPTDCSVTGFDGLEAPKGLPRVTSMLPPHTHMGSCALTRLVNRLIYPTSSQRNLLFKTLLVPGDTLAAPRR